MRAKIRSAPARAFRIELNCWDICVIGWKKGEFYFDPVPASFETVEELDGMVYNYFCGANLSKYLIQMSKKEGKTAVF